MLGWKRMLPGLFAISVMLIMLLAGAAYTAPGDGAQLSSYDIKSSIPNGSDIVTLGDPEVFIEEEPNDNRSQANMVNSNYYGTPPYLVGGKIDHLHDKDYFRFDVKANGKFEIFGWWDKEDLWGQEVDYGIHLEDANGNVIEAAQLIGEGADSARLLIKEVPPGTYYVVATTLGNHDLYLGEWYIFYVFLEAVSTPDRPSGPERGSLKNSYTFATGGANCSWDDLEGHTAQYRFDWGDGGYSDWSPSASAENSWDNPGTYQVRAQARCAVSQIESSWSPSLTVTITAKRISGSDRYETAVKISQAGWASSKNVVLSTGLNFPDALAGAPLAYALDAPILLTHRDKLMPATEQEIKRLGANRVFILGSEGAVSKKVADDLGQMGLSVVRIGGKDRYETAANIALRSELGGASTAVIAYSHNFPDALAAASYAARHGYPILMSGTDQLPAATTKAINSLALTEAVIVGGTGVISNKVRNQLRDNMGLDVRRVSGDDRFATSVALAEGYLPAGADHLYIATGLSFPDALTGAVLAARENTGILSVGHSVPPEVRAFLDARNLTYMFILGGTAAVSADLEGALNDPDKYCSVSTPLRPSGPTSGSVNTSYTFTSGAACFSGHPVELGFSWGDGTSSGWSSSPSATKSWSSPGTYFVQARARCAVNKDTVSGWSQPLTVTIK